MYAAARQLVNWSAQCTHPPSHVYSCLFTCLCNRCQMMRNTYITRRVRRSRGLHHPTVTTISYIHIYIRPLTYITTMFCFTCSRDVLIIRSHASQGLLNLYRVAVECGLCMMDTFLQERKGKGIQTISGVARGRKGGLPRAAIRRGRKNRGYNGKNEGDKGELGVSRLLGAAKL